MDPADTWFSMFQRCFGYMSDESFTTMVKDHHQPGVTLDTFRMGNDVVIVKNGHRICGSGGALASAAILQDKAYFEVKVQQSSGEFGVGLAVSSVDLNRVPLGQDADSWILRSDGCVYHSGHKVFDRSNGPVVQEGDIIGVAFDHISLKFLINNQDTGCTVTGIRQKDEKGVFPVFYVDDGAILDTAFESFSFDPPDGYSRILIEQSLL